MANASVDSTWITYGKGSARAGTLWLTFQFRTHTVFCHPPVLLPSCGHILQVATAAIKSFGPRCKHVYWWDPSRFAISVDANSCISIWRWRPQRPNSSIRAGSLFDGVITPGLQSLTLLMHSQYCVEVATADANDL